MAVPSDNKFQRAMALLHGGKVEEAEKAFRELLKQQPRHVGALNLLSIALVQQGKFAEAEQFIKRALEENQQSDTTLYNYGLILRALDRPAEALARFSQALAINSTSAETWNNRGAIFNELGRYKEAIADFDKAISIDSNFSAAYCNKGRSLGILKLYDQALNAYDKALTLNSQMTEAWGGRGNILSDLKQYHKALEAFDKALSLNPNLVESWSGRGGALYGLNRLHEALTAYDKALALNPNLAAAWMGRGIVFEKLHQFDDAAAAYERAITLKPPEAGAWLGRGNMHFMKHKYADALASYNNALALEPDFAEALIGRGNVFSERQMFDHASDDFDRALLLQPNLAEAWQGRGNLHLNNKQYADAFAAYEKAFLVKPDLKYLEGSRIYTKQFICDWSNWDVEVSHLLSAVRKQEPAVLPFVLLSIASSSTDQLLGAKSYIACQPSYAPYWRGERYSHDRVRIAYVSSDLREHPVARLMAEVFERHDRSRFEITAISLGSAHESAIRARIKAAVECFVDTQDLEDDKIAEYIHRHEIDIVVDLNGHTEGARHGVLARRPAPVQINYLGYPATMGAEYIDYIIADRTVIPADQHNFLEKIIYMPDSFQANDYRGHASDRVISRAQAALPPDGFVFCSFNTNYKITPRVFDLWMRILRQVEDAVLWLYVENPTAQKNLLHEAEMRGIAAGRLIFAPRLSLSEHQSRLPLADLFLDTSPFNAGATASGAISAGVPVLTCAGDTYSGRMGASLLKAVRLPELITPTAESYVSMAVELATQPGKIAVIKRKLANNIGFTPLFDTQRFTRHLESAYLTVHARQQRGEPPDTFDVEATTQNLH